MRFTRFIGIDWSGARGLRHPSIQLAVATIGSAPPQLVPPPGGAWSRLGVLDWLQVQQDDVLVGIDAGLGFAAIPGCDGPARDLWAEIDRVAAADPDLGGHRFIDHRRELFWTGIADGPRALRAHLRVAEQVHAASRAGTPTSNFVLLGAAQVGKATLSAMRLAHRLGWPAWPFDPLPTSGPVILEIYAQAFAAMAGTRGKLRTRAALDGAIAHFGSAPLPGAFPAVFADHIGDAIVTAAGLRAIAAEPRWWAPPAMTRAIAATEGWTFGIA
ncbi:hypothetical protein IP88_11475 [alpha proteobacterium AAP81b]|nr:hypothetical protein IP88_11475 [alpha proteobacterium AAP81b]